MYANPLTICIYIERDAHLARDFDDKRQLRPLNLSRNRLGARNGAFEQGRYFRRVDEIGSERGDGVRVGFGGGANLNIRKIVSG